MRNLIIGIMIGVLATLLAGYAIFATISLRQRALVDQIKAVAGQRDMAYRVLAGNGIIAPLKDAQGNTLMFDKQGRVLRAVAQDGPTTSTKAGGN